MKTIGKLAKELDINVETVRFYERKGIIVQGESMNAYNLASTTPTPASNTISK
ncbi:MerR family DNA-binding transcriptional regulator, partial [Rheinheimera sp.]|uniref:MerR family DNA-binding transcriptional regulator n=1 Tax=Rheinheimera sp. TaxID=1869214 RepID=UPI003AF993EF